MAETPYRYIIVGAGLAGASAVQGIREHDREGSILLIGDEGDLPYNRPPLTKGLWLGKKKLEEIYVQPAEFYEKQRIDVKLNIGVTQLDAQAHVVTDSWGHTYRYEKLLLATGGRPRHLDLPGGDLDGIIYYRYLDDYRRIRALAKPGASAVIIGGGFIGSELSAALNVNGVAVTTIFPEAALVQRVFPESLGRVMVTLFRQRGINVLSQDAPVSFEKHEETFVTHTKSGQAVESQILVIGAGISPNVQLAKEAGLTIDNGIVVDEYVQTSDPDIYAAGDNANFPYVALEGRRRIEHWDHALNQGNYAGRNMAGAQDPYDYMPYFFSDLFDFGYEAVGDVDSRLDIVTDWIEENTTGTIYYMREGKVRGVMLCNIWGQLDAARELITSNMVFTPEELRGAIKPSQEKAA